MTFLTELAANATAQSVDIIIYVGNDDAVSPHFGTEGEDSIFAVALPGANAPPQSRYRCVRALDKLNTPAELFTAEHDVRRHPGLHSQTRHTVV